MGRKLALLGAALFLSAGLSIPAFAWDSYGHMEVAYVAYQKLSPAAKARVDALLQMNPDYSNWTMMIPDGTSEAQKKLMVFMFAATWPDAIKGEAQYSDDGTNGGNTPDGNSSSQNTGYRDLLRHKYWHFIDTPFSTDGTQLPQIPTPNAQERIALFRATLASTSDDSLKSYDLAWLLHLVGDVHQPLHCATRVDSTLTQGDEGGNKVKLKCSGCAAHLHTYWDDLLGSGSTPQAVVNSVMRAAQKLAPADPALAAITDEKAWVAESFQEAQQNVYQAPVGPGLGPFALTTAYKNAAKTLAKQRIALAGTRLANLINNELK